MKWVLEVDEEEWERWRSAEPPYLISITELEVRQGILRDTRRVAFVDRVGTSTYPQYAELDGVLLSIYPKPDTEVSSDDGRS